jgi:soluble lytic murein transglycosylase
MQLMPATAKRTAQRFGVGYDQERLLDDPAYNAKLGSAHLGELMQDWKGSYILTFASYNAGGGNVKKWIDAYGDPRKAEVDAIDWVERIPFSETRNYVQRVMENLQVYRHRLEERSALLIERDLRRGGAVVQ